jgi:AcrR family transcriptional regulator
MTPPAKTAKAERTQARLLAAAVEAFAQKGFHGTTTRDIATLAGISPTALYVHHESKEELLYLIALTGHIDALRVVTAAAEAPLDPAAKLHRLVHDFALHHAVSHKLSRVVNYELSALAPDHRAEVGELRRQISENIRAVVNEGVDAGQFGVVDHRLTVTAIESLSVDIARWYRDDGLPPETVALTYADMVLRLVEAH